MWNGIYEVPDETRNLSAQEKSGSGQPQPGSYKPQSFRVGDSICEDIGHTAYDKLIDECPVNILL